MLVDYRTTYFMERAVLKKYWIEIIAFVLIFAVLLTCNLPQLTWINTDSDSAHYLYASKYMQVAHNMSQPLYLLLGRLFLFLPFGSEAWRMGLISVIATTACAMMIYLVVRHHLKSHSRERLYAIISALIYGGSALVISQSTIIETYALATLLSVSSYYSWLKKKYVLTSLLLGLGLAVHSGLTAMCWGCLFVSSREMRNWKFVAITGSFLLMYAYVPIVTLISGDEGMWGNTTMEGFVSGNAGTVLMLTGALSIYDFPKRLLDTIGILGVSLGLGFIVTVWYFIKQKTYKSILLWLTLFPTLYFITNLSAETYVYLLPTIAYGAIVTGIALSHLNIKVAYATLALAICLMGFNLNYFDIGRTLDPNLSAHKYYTEELPKLNDGDILLTGGWTWAIAYLYNKEEGRELIPICTDILPSDKYLDQLEDNGIKLTRSTSDVHLERTFGNALSIVENNPNVWLAKETNPSTYEYELVPAEGNEWLFTRWLGYETKAEWRWKPSNPYHFITGALEVSEWKFILKTNHNMLLAMTSGLTSIAIYLAITKYSNRKKKLAEQNT